MRLMSDVPLGAMLSGGLDSSLIVALMARHMDQPVDTFAVGFAGDRLRAGRRAPRRRVQRRQPPRARGGARHRARRMLATLSWHMDEPLADLSSLGFLALSRAGGVRRSPSRFRPGRRRAVRRLSQAPGRLAGECLGPHARRRGGRSPRRPCGVPRAAPAACSTRSRRPTRSRACWPRAASCTPTCSRGLFAGALAEHERRRRALIARAPRRRAGRRRRSRPRCSSMPSSGWSTTCSPTSTARRWRCSLEVRVPFLDHELVELCARIPASAKVRRLQGKHVLRLASRGLVPDFVLEKRKRGFFNEAVGAWLGADDGAHDRRAAAAPTTPPTPSSSTPPSCGAPSAEFRGGPEAPRAAAAVAGHARALARRVPAARVRDAPAARERPPRERCATPSSRPRATSRTTCRGSPPRSPPRTSRRVAWVVVDDGSADGDAGRCWRSWPREHPWVRAGRRGRPRAARRARPRAAARGARWTAFRVGVDGARRSRSTSSSRSMPTSTSTRTTSSA